MLRLTEETGQPVRTASGERIGRVVDLVLTYRADHDVVRALAVGHGHRIEHLVPWSDVASFEHTEVVLRDGVAGAVTVPDHGPVPLAADELLLVRDVLDTQIVDTAGKRLVRVGDVLLTRVADERLRVTACEVGAGAVLRRLGLRARWLTGRFSAEIVPWTDLHLTSARGHAVQLVTPSAALHRLGPHDLAVLLAHLSVESGADVLAAVPAERAASALTAAHPDLSNRVVLAFEEDEAGPVLDALPASRAARMRHLRRAPHALGRRVFRSRGWRRRLPLGHRRGGRTTA